MCHQRAKQAPDSIGAFLLSPQQHVLLLLPEGVPESSASGKQVVMVLVLGAFLAPFFILVFCFNLFVVLVYLLGLVLGGRGCWAFFGWVGWFVCLFLGFVLFI